MGNFIIYTILIAVIVIVIVGEIIRTKREKNNPVKTVKEKLVKAVKEKILVKKKNKMKDEKRNIIGGIIIGVVLLVILLIYLNPIPYTEEVCTRIDSDYHIEEAVYSEECIDYVISAGCVEKMITCSVDVSNLETKAGVWSITLSILGDVDTYPGISTTLDYSIYGQNNRIFETYYITPYVYEDYDCYYDIASVPTKEVCETITKYRRLWEKK